MSLTPPQLADIRCLAFDVFGTVVDWRSSIIREGESLGRARGLEVDWAAFADAWRAGYAPSMNRVRQGRLSWTSLDQLHRMTLDRLLEEFGITELSEADKANFNRAWHRLKPWPDAVNGMHRLRERFILTPLSNGNMSLLVNMAKQACLPWDCVLSAELARHYKRDPEVYRMAARLLDLSPQQIMMVAAHQDDLKAAHSEGLHTAFVMRPLEFGPQARPDLTVDPIFDYVASDFHDLADQLLSRSVSYPALALK
ncbi:haloacid dehalogenase type II [Halomonas sp. DQ26W]|uniref:haloacid dehalogenase type II n=1 Tax=Halomonas sp. DQ26W TaxID=2282311 RepID=UPI000DF7C8EC|nr:haloacid dehalogenase type II [Halomonas sp. DQ26W]RDB43103.1 haloacid dehalogenase type II [Halomonas sp. DQ26W]